jgi:hypothetical protein
VAVTTIVALTIASGFVHGRVSGRWSSGQVEHELEKKLEVFPRDFGSWQLQESLLLTPYAQSVLECRSYLHRHYVHRDTGKAVTVAVLVGPAGPISVHTPEICYSTRDYELREERVQANIRLNEKPAHLWKTTLYPTGTAQHSVRVYYGWNDGRGWVAPEEPRFFFVGKRRLYKVQLAASLPSVSNDQDDPCTEFLEQFLPVLEKYLLKPAGHS